MANVTRPLINQNEIRGFFRDVLDIDISDPKELQNWADLIGYISECELTNVTFSDPKKSTLNSSDNRHSSYSEDKKRWELRTKIVQELLEKDRLDDDDKIKIGKGGAKPKGDVKHENEAFIIIGPPASGKSGFAGKIADSYGAYILDNDFSKRKFPEFNNLKSGATLLHEESAAIMLPKNISGMPATFKTLFQICVEKGANIVIPKIGHNYVDIYSLAKLLKEKFNYKVHLIAISLDRKSATFRALHRLKETRRYVPLSLIFDGYGNEPILSYYRLKRIYPKEFESFGKISTDVPRAQKYEVIEFDENSPVSLFVK